MKKKPSSEKKSDKELKEVEAWWENVAKPYLLSGKPLYRKIDISEKV